MKKLLFFMCVVLAILGCVTDWDGDNVDKLPCFLCDDEYSSSSSNWPAYMALPAD
jgi:hypothetical protein